MHSLLNKRESTETDELYSAWSLFIVCGLLIISLLTSYYLQIKRIRAIHETVVSIFAGMFVGLIVRLGPGHLIREKLSFSHMLFFNLLLPPIILNSGYEMRQENFFRNFGSILVFAFLGTFIAAMGLGILVYIWSFLGLEGLNLSIRDCLIFGSTLSATDPVTILSIFQQHKVDPKLYSIIFGESLLNDAVSIVMYETLSQFDEKVTFGSLVNGVGIFLVSFSSSMAMGVAIGLFTSLVLKHSHLALYPSIESCLVALLAYISYFFSNGLHMSGIVSLLFCGITLKHYAYHTMSRRTQRTTKYLFSVLAQLSENFIFIYLGLNLFTQEFAVFKPLFILVSVVSVVATRYLSVFPLSEAINLFHKWRGQRFSELPHSYQMMLFWAGLRGAVGVALAAGFTGKNSDALRTTVLVVVVLTVIMFGGTTARMLEVMNIRTGVEEGEESSSDEEERAWLRSGRIGPVGGRWDDRANSRFRGEFSPAVAGYRHGRRWSRSNAQPPPLHTSNSSVFDAGSSDSDGNEVLPMSRGDHNNYNHHHQSRSMTNPAYPRSRGSPGGSNNNAGVGPSASTAGLREAGEAWFHAIDERYLLPLFSNAVASRTFHARRAKRRAAVAPDATGDPNQNSHQNQSHGPYEDSEFESYPGSPVEAASPAGSFHAIDGVTGAVKRKNQEVLRSIGSFWRGSPSRPARLRDDGRNTGTASPAQGVADTSGLAASSGSPSQGQGEAGATSSGPLGPLGGTDSAH